MIITLTPNPSIDRAFSVAELELGEVNRASSERADPGGKGINVSRALRAHGIPSTAIVPMGEVDDTLLRMLSRAGVTTHPLRIPGHTRSNITIIDNYGQTTKVNAPGPELNETIAAEMAASVLANVSAGDTLLAAGSLPRGISDDFYARLARSANDAGAKVVLDTSGAPLAKATQGGGLYLIKPNELELAEIVGKPLPRVGDVVEAARQIIARGTVNVLVSLGGNGALLITETGCWWGGGPALIPVSTVGAGDITLAGFLSAEGKEPPERLRTAVAWGRAAVLLPGTEVPAPTQIHPHEVEIIADPDFDIPIKEM